MKDNFVVKMYTQDGESKYHVANILSSMANGGHPSVTLNGSTYAIPSGISSYSNAIASATGTTTSTLTPTSLSNIEQTFIELQSVPTTSTIQNPLTQNALTQSGFVPPIVHSMASASASDNDMYGSDSGSSQSHDEDYYSTPKKLRIGDKTTTIMSKYEIENPQRKTHRRQLKNEQVSPEEAARRCMRRERNKVAAAKCRQRRVDHTNRLLNETDKLEVEQQSIENEIQTLQQERDQLEFIIQAHSPLCKVRPTNPLVKVKAEPETDTRSPRPHISAPIAHSHSQSSSKQELPMSRPSTLSLLKRDVKSELSSAAGIAITTPSSGFYSFSLDTMVDHTGLTPLTGSLGHTGLTPITSMPSTCSTEASKKQSTSSESSDGMKSPSSLITL